MNPIQQKKAAKAFAEFWQDKGYEKAEYGQKIVATLSQQLTERYGRGFTISALFRTWN